MYFALNPKYSLFACRLNEWSSAFPQLSSSGAVGIFAVAARETTWGDTPLHDAARNGHPYYSNVEAAELLLSKGATVDATNNNGAGPQSGKQGENPVSSLGHLRRVFCRDWNLRKNVCIFSKCLAKLWVSNVTCQYVWNADGLTCRWNTSHKMANFEECCMRLPVGTGRRSRIQPI